MIKMIQGKNAIPENWNYKAPHGVDLYIVRDHEKLSKHADKWDELLLKAKAEPTNSYAWISSFMKNLVEADEAWLCMFAYRDGELIGVLPLVIRKACRILGVSVILCRPPYNVFHTYSVRCLMPPDNDEAFDIFYDCLSSIPRSIPILKFRDITEDSMKINKRLISEFSFSENYIPLPEKYEDYHATLSSNTKRQLKKGTKKLDGNHDVSFIDREADKTAGENFNMFLDTEHANWKGREKTSIKSVPEHTKALHDIAVEMHKRGWMEWGTIMADGKPVAAHYSINVNRCVYIIKIGFDDQFSAYSPGNLLFNKIIEESCNSGNVDEINVCANCDWHNKWQVKSRDKYHVTIIPDIPVIGLIAHKGYKYLAKYLKR